MCVRTRTWVWGSSRWLEVLKIHSAFHRSRSVPDLSSSLILTTNRSPQDPSITSLRDLSGRATDREEPINGFWSGEPSFPTRFPRHLHKIGLTSESPDSFDTKWHESCGGDRPGWVVAALNSRGGPIPCLDRVLVPCTVVRVVFIL